MRSSTVKADNARQLHAVHVAQWSERCTGTAGSIPAEGSMVAFFAAVHGQV